MSHVVYLRPIFEITCDVEGADYAQRCQEAADRASDIVGRVEWPLTFVGFSSRVREREKGKSGETKLIVDWAVHPDAKPEVGSAFRCPACWSDDIGATDSPESLEPDRIEQSVVCNNCDTTWDEVYELRQIINVQPHRSPA